MQATLLKTCLLLICIVTTSVQAQEQSIDYLSLAGRLVHDGDYARAEETLQKVPEADRETEKFILVKSLLNLYQERFSEALVGFEELISMGTKDRYVYIYKGQALYGLGRYEKALAAFDQVQDLADSISSIALIRCRALWALERWSQAWETLHRAIAVSKGDFRFVQLKTNWLLNKGLHQQAYEFILKKMANQSIPLSDRISLASALRGQGLVEESIKALEILRLANRDNVNTTIQLAYSYLKDEQVLVAAQLFHEASLQNRDYVFEAAELYRRAGWFQSALLLNRQVPDQKKKFQQRLTILISQGEFELATSTEADLSRLGLLDSEEIRYALAFAFFKSRQYVKVEKHLAYITKAELFKKAIALRKEIAQCKTASQCV